MATTQPNFAAFIFGGIFVGAWVYGLLFGFPEWHDFSEGQWGLWGLLGIAVAGGLYAARVTSDWVRVLIIVIVGAFLGILFLAMVLEEEAHIIAAFVSATGAGLIAAALPGPSQWEEVTEDGQKA